MIDFPSGIIQGILSNPKQKDQKYLKAKLNRIRLKNQEVYQLSYYTKKQVFHENIAESQLNEKLNELLQTMFKEATVSTAQMIYGYRITAKGKVLSNRKAQKKRVCYVGS